MVFLVVLQEFDNINNSNYLSISCFRFVQDGSDFVKYLSLGSVQMCGLTNTALPPVSSKLEKLYSDCAMAHSHELLLTMAAGLPHFSVGFMRCWGRDTFIALRGLLLVTERFAVAR